MGRDPSGSEDDIVKEYVAFDVNQIKTEKQLTDIWNEANKTS